jgi:hypothetical protein
MADGENFGIGNLENVVDELARRGKLKPRTVDAIRKRIAENIGDKVVDELDDQNPDEEVQAAAAVPASPADVNQTPTDLGIPEPTQQIPEQTQPEAQQALPVETPVVEPQPADASQFVQPPAPEEAAAPDARVGGLEGGFDQQIASQAAQANIDSQAAQAERGVIQQSRQELDQLQAQQAQELDKIEHKVAGQMNRLADLQNNLLSSKTDPDRLVSNMSTAGKISAFIGIALGGLSGGSNQALAAFQKSIDRDIRSQEQDIARKKEGINIQQSLIANLRSQFTSRRAAQSGARLIMAEKFKRDLQDVAARFKSPTIQAKALDAIGKLNVLKNQESAKLQTELEKEAIKSGTKFGKAGKFDPNKLSEQERESLIPGIGIATSKEAKKNFIRETEGLQPSVDMIGDLLVLADKPGSSFNLKDRTKAEVIRKALAGKLRIPFLGPGIMTEQEFQRLLDLLGNPTALSRLSVLERQKLNTVQSILKKDIATASQRAGIESAKDVISFQPQSK